MDTEILLNKFDDFNNEENIIEPFTDNYYKLKKWLTTIGGQLDAPTFGEWVDIKSELPPEFEGVLIKTRDNEITVTEFNYEKDKNGLTKFWLNGHCFGGYEWDYDFSNSKITHWMPLPKP